MIENTHFQRLSLAVWKLLELFQFFHNCTHRQMFHFHEKILLLCLLSGSAGTCMAQHSWRLLPSGCDSKREAQWICRFGSLLHSGNTVVANDVLIISSPPFLHLCTVWPNEVIEGGYGRGKAGPERLAEPETLVL